MNYFPYRHLETLEQETIGRTIKGMTAQSETVEKREGHAVRASHATRISSRHAPPQRAMCSAEIGLNDRSMPPTDAALSRTVVLPGFGP